MREIPKKNLDQKTVFKISTNGYLLKILVYQTSLHNKRKILTDLLV